MLRWVLLCITIGSLPAARAESCAGTKLATQAEVDSFVNCTSITDDDLTIEGADIETINLPNLETIDYSLRIINCPKLSNVAFDSLSSVGTGRRFINDGLVIASAGFTAPSQGAIDFPNLRTSNGNVHIDSVSNVLSISIPMLRSAGQINTNGNEIHVSACPQLTSIAIGSSTETAWITGNVYIFNNNALQSVSMDELTECTSLVVQQQSSQLMLASFLALDKIQSGGLTVQGTSGPSGAGALDLVFPNLTSVGGSVQITNLQHLEELSFPELAEIRGGSLLLGYSSSSKLEALTLVSMPKLAEIDGRLDMVYCGSTSSNPLVLEFESLALIANDVQISYCHSLAELHFPSLASVGAGVDLQYNNDLSNLNFPALETLGSITSQNIGFRVFRCGSTGAASGALTLSSLRSAAGRLLLDGANHLRAVSVPLLSEAGNGYYGNVLFIGSCLDLEEADVGSSGARWVTRGITIVNNAKLQSLRLEQLEAATVLSIGGVTPDFVLLSLPALQTLQLDLVIDGDDGLGPAPLTLDFSNLTKVEGSITITDLANLETLAMPLLDEVGGDIQIGVNSASRFFPMLSVISFPKLAIARGNLRLLRIGDNAPSLSLSLPELASVQGHFQLQALFQLELLDLPSLTTVGGAFDVYECTLLHTVSAPALERTGAGGSQCGGCSIRMDLTGMTSTETGGALELPALVSLGGLFVVQRNEVLRSIEAPLVRDLGPQYGNNKKVVHIENNAQLEQVRVASESAVPFSALAIYINANTKLRSLHMDMLSAVDSLTISNVGVDFSIASFGSLNSVVATLLLSGTEGLVVDPLTLHFPELTTVGGAITVTNLRNLEEFALPSLDQVGGSLTIGRYYYGTEPLPLLSTVFLANLTTVGGNLALYTAGATSPTTMAISLDSLVLVRGDIDISGVPNLEEVDLPALSRVDGKINVEDCPALFRFFPSLLVSTGSTFRIKNCGASATATGEVHMPALLSTGGAVSIESASGVTRVMMPLLSAIGGTGTSITVTNCPDLEVVTIGSEGSEWAVLGVYVHNNAMLRSLRCDTITAARTLQVSSSTPELELISFPALERVEQYVQVTGSDGLVNNPLVLDFTNLTTIGTYLSISNTRNLEAVEFPRLESVGSYLTLGSTSYSNLLPQLAAISFPLLTSIGGNLGVYRAGGSSQQRMEMTMPELVSVSGEVVLQYLDNLWALELASLARVDKALQITNCPRLADISLSSLETTGQTSYNYGVRISSCGGSAEGSGVLSLPQLTRTGGRLVMEYTGGFRQLLAPLLRETGLGYNGNTVWIGTNADLEEVEIGSSGELWTTNQVELLDCPALQSVRMDRLAQAGLVKLSAMTSQLQQVSFHSLETVALGGGYSIYMEASGGGTQNELLLNFPSLRTTAGQIYLDGTQNLAIVNMPALERVGERFFVRGCNFLRSVLVPKLEAVGVTSGASLWFQNSGSESTDVLTLDFPLLNRVSGNIVVDTVANLRELSFPNLTAVDGYLTVQDNAKLASIQMPKATRVGAGSAPSEGIRIQDNGGTADEVGTANFESVTDLAGVVYFRGNQNMRSLMLQQLKETGEGSGGYPLYRDTITVSNSQDLEEVSIGSRGDAWVTNSIVVENNPALGSLSMKKLQRCMRLRITGNSRIGPLCFPNLLEIAEYSGQGLVLQDNGLMAPGCWFFSARNLAVVAGSVVVSGNTKLVLFDMNGLGPEDPGLDDNTACFNCPFEPVKMCPSCILCDSDVDVVRLQCSADACGAPAPTYVNDTLRCTRPPVVGPSCDTDITWAELLESGEFHAGGLGDLMEEDGFESWMCMAHSCTGGSDLSCYKYSEGGNYFEYWGSNAVLGLVTV